jgi:folate-binding protein YgfZ
MYRKVIKISGSDAESLIQRLVTNDIKKQEWVYSFLLNNRGRYLFDFFVLKVEADYCIDIHEQSCEEFVKKIQLYKMQDDVKVEDISDNFCVIYTALKEGNSLFSDRDPRYVKMGFRNLVDFVKNPKTRADIGASEALYNSDKYMHALPDGNTDMKYGRSFPLDYGAEQLNGVSYTKGCYIGQEVISRAKNYGVVRKRVMKVISDSTMKVGDLIFDQMGQKVGHVCSVYENIVSNVGIALTNGYYENISIKSDSEKDSKLDSQDVKPNFQASLIIPEWQIDSEYKKQ